VALLRADPPSKDPTDSLKIKKLKRNKAFNGCSILQSGSNRRERVGSVQESVKRGLELGDRLIAIVGAVTRKRLVTD
jgi:hypothetical protein